MDFDNLSFGIANPRVKEAITDSKNRPIVFFGTGLFFDSFDELLARRGVSFAAADNNPHKWGKTLAESALIIPPSELTGRYGDSYVCVAINDARFYREIYAQIIELGIKPERILSFTEIIVNLERESLGSVYKSLSDNESKEVLRAFYSFDFTGRIENMKKLCAGEQYFPADIIKLSENEVFIDAGAFTGDTAEAFIRHTAGRFNAIHSFEPSNENATRFLDNHSGDKRIILHRVGLGSENKSAGFNENGSGGQVRYDGSETIQIERLDDVLDGGAVTFIKMDIEGAEMSALLGAEQTIRRFLPKLAICVYHKAVDIIQIPAFIKQCFPGYKLYLRQHSESQYETVLYAVAD